MVLVKNFIQSLRLWLTRRGDCVMDVYGQHVMIDIETLSIQPNATILELVAVPFNINTIQVENAFVGLPNVDSQINRGSAIDFSTVKFWIQNCMQSKDLAETVIQGSRYADNTAFLTNFENWFKKAGLTGAYVWSKGRLDMTSLDYMFKSHGFRELPWYFWNECDVRSYTHVLPSEYEQTKPVNPHDPMADCVAQIFNVQKVMKYLQDAMSTGAFKTHFIA